eukprot:scaffold7712_cov267-Pinguiococcus_pyrenoidosus.AAC.2
MRSASRRAEMNGSGKQESSWIIGAWQGLVDLTRETTYLGGHLAFAVLGRVPTWTEPRPAMRVPGMRWQRRARQATRQIDGVRTVAHEDLVQKQNQLDQEPGIVNSREQDRMHAALVLVALRSLRFHGASFCVLLCPWEQLDEGTKLLEVLSHGAGHAGNDLKGVRAHLLSGLLVRHPKQCPNLTSTKPKPTRATSTSRLCCHLASVATISSATTTLSRIFCASFPEPEIAARGRFLVRVASESLASSRIPVDGVAFNFVYQVALEKMAWKPWDSAEDEDGGCFFSLSSGTTVPSSGLAACGVRGEAAYLSMNASAKRSNASICATRAVSGWTLGACSYRCQSSLNKAPVYEVQKTAGETLGFHPKHQNVRASHLITAEADLD